MAVLETIRVKFGVVITVLIAIALLSFIVDPTSLQSLTGSKEAKKAVGEINGEKITYIDFSEEYEKMNAIYGSNSSENSADEVRMMAWNALMYDNLYIPAAEKAGFNVGDDEMYYLLSGTMYSPIIAQEFQGMMTPEYLAELENNIIPSDNTGRMQAVWDNITENVKNSHFMTKYSSLLVQGSLTNDLILNDMMKNNDIFNVDFVMIPYDMYTRDTTIKVTDKEIETYYNSRKNSFRQGSGRDIEYVVFEVIPSAEDIALAREDMNRLYEEFKTTDNMRSFLMSNSVRSYDNRWYKSGELTAISNAVNDYVFGTDATVSEIIENGNTFQAVRVMETDMVPDEVFINQIALDIVNAAKADSIMNVMTAANADALAAEFSAIYDPAEEKQGAWTPLNAILSQVPAFNMDKPFAIETGNGEKIICLVTDKSELVEKKRVAVLEVQALASDNTRSGYYAQANELASKSAGNYEKFQQAVREAGLYAHPISRMPETASSLGAVNHTKEITRWAFNSGKGSVSDIFTIGNDFYIVAAVTGVHSEGYAPISDVRMGIEQILYSEKVADKKLAEVTEKVAGITSLEEVAAIFGRTVSSKENMTFFSTDLDPEFAGAASVAEAGVVNAPVKGANGVYVYMVTDNSVGTFYTDADPVTRKNRLANEYVYLLDKVMIEEGDVHDHTPLFF